MFRTNPPLSPFLTRIASKSDFARFEAAAHESVLGCINETDPFRNVVDRSQLDDICLFVHSQLIGLFNSHDNQAHQFAVGGLRPKTRNLRERSRRAVHMPFLGTYSSIEKKEEDR